MTQNSLFTHDIKKLPRCKNKILIDLFDTDRYTKEITAFDFYLLTHETVNLIKHNIMKCLS